MLADYCRGRGAVVGQQETVGTSRRRAEFHTRQTVPSVRGGLSDQIKHHRTGTAESTNKKKPQHPLRPSTHQPAISKSQSSASRTTHAPLKNPQTIFIANALSR